MMKNRADRNMYFSFESRSDTDQPYNHHIQDSV